MCETGRFTERARFIHKNGITSTSCQSPNVMIHDSNDLGEGNMSRRTMRTNVLQDYSMVLRVLSTRRSGSVTVTLFLVL
jgi:hypothetical protein